jgi:hypothetical protein
LADSERTRRERGGGSPLGAKVPEFRPDHLIRLKKIDAIDANVRLLIRYGFLAIVAFFAYRAVNILAGQHTFADLGVKIFADVRIGNAIGYAVGGGGIAYGARQRKLRGDTIQKMGKRIKELETAVDPNRSSSGLTERGHTRPEDEL